MLVFPADWKPMNPRGFEDHIRFNLLGVVVFDRREATLDEMLRLIREQDISMEEAIVRMQTTLELPAWCRVARRNGETDPYISLFDLKGETSTLLSVLHERDGEYLAGEEERFSYKFRTRWIFITNESKRAVIKGKNLDLTLMDGNIHQVKVTTDSEQEEVIRLFLEEGVVPSNYGITPVVKLHVSTFNFLIVDIMSALRDKERVVIDGESVGDLMVQRVPGGFSVLPVRGVLVGQIFRVNIYPGDDAVWGQNSAGPNQPVLVPDEQFVPGMVLCVRFPD